VERLGRAKPTEVTPAMQANLRLTTVAPRLQLLGVRSTQLVAKDGSWEVLVEADLDVFDSVRIEFELRIMGTSDNQQSFCPYEYRAHTQQVRARPVRHRL